MNVLVATWIVRCVALYVALGLAVALPFALRGVDRIDPSARRAGLGFRVLVLPGSVALWPIVLRRWIAGAQPVERNAHRDVARAGRDGA